MKRPQSIVVISLRYLGDLLLTTPLVRSLRRAYPEARLDALVPPGVETVLEGNPDIDHVLTSPRGAWKRYDLAVVAETADRPHHYGWLTARARAGLLPPEPEKRWWKWLLLGVAVEAPHERPRLESYARLAAALGIAWEPTIVAPTAHTDPATWTALLGFDPRVQPFAALHFTPRFRYKRWHAGGWRALIEWLHGRGVRVVVLGGAREEERRYVDEVLADCPVPVTDVAGRLSLAQAADLLRLAATYVGPDTATTHLAAACGAPTVALFGPTDPRLWGPVPRSGAAGYERVAAAQARGNVMLLQQPSLPCVPCQKEGCERHRESFSACLDAMEASRVIDAVRAQLDRREG